MGAVVPPITADLVRRLLEDQFPDWDGLPIRKVQPGGWDNRTFRLGAELAVRLPSAKRYAPQVEKEHRWLPHLARHLDVPVPQSVAIGKPGQGYPWPWSVRRWLPGATADADMVSPCQLTRLADQLASFLTALHQVPTAEGPEPGAHNFMRGAHPGFYADEVADCLPLLPADGTREFAARIWDRAMETRWEHPSVWLHGDFAPGNLLLDVGGELAAVIDFGSMAVGDPACDLAIAYTLLDPPARHHFRQALPHLDVACWQRARGWVLWKSLLTLRESGGAVADNPPLLAVLSDCKD